MNMASGLPVYLKNLILMLLQQPKKRLPKLLNDFFPGWVLFKQGRPAQPVNISV